MANRRIINCDIFEDEWYGQLDFFEQQLWIGLFSRMADDQGRLLDNPILIGRYIFLYKSIDPDKVDQALAGFHNAGKIIRYEIGGKKLIQIKRWWENQRPQWANPSDYLPPEGWNDRVRTRINGSYFVENWNQRDDSKHSGGMAPEKAPEDHKTDLGARHVPIPVPVPDPIPVPVPVVNASATANFFSKFQSIAGPLMGNKQVDQIKDLLEENGAEKILEIARWLVKDKGETSMYKIIAAIRTAAPEWKSGNSNESVFEEWLKNGNKTNSNAADAAIEQASPAVQTNA